jgi:transcriptional regulator with XRE-family HTH domain
MRVPSGFEIAAARVLLGLTQAEVAKAAKVDASTLSRIEAAGNDAPRGLLRNVQAVLSVLEAKGVEFIENGVRRRPRGRQR